MGEMQKLQRHLLSRGLWNFIHTYVPFRKSLRNAVVLSGSEASDLLHQTAELVQATTRSNLFYIKNDVTDLG